MDWLLGLTDTLSNLCVGSYTSIINDSNLCSKSIGPIIIDAYDDIEATFEIDSAECTKGDGEIAVIPMGADVFTFQWYDHVMTPLGTDSVQSNLTSGVYHVSLTSKTTNCSKLFTVTLSDVGSPKLLVDSLISPSCYGSCDGNIFITVNGVNKPF